MKFCNYHKILFWLRVKKGKIDECWNWTRSIMENGYGQIRIDKKHYYTHRLAVFFTKGYMPTDFVLHKCDNRACCNPHHLFEGIPKDNIQDMLKKKRNNPTRGIKSGKTKLTNKDVIDIRCLRRFNATLQEIANYYGIVHQTVSDITTRKTWKHV